MGTEKIYIYNWKKVRKLAKETIKIFLQLLEVWAHTI